MVGGEVVEQGTSVVMVSSSPGLQTVVLVQVVMVVVVIDGPVLGEGVIRGVVEDDSDDAGLVTDFELETELEVEFAGARRCKLRS